MAGNKTGLEGKLKAGEPKITMDTNLSKFAGMLQQDRRTGKKKGIAFHLARCMLGYLYRGEYPGMGYVKLKPVHTIRELYSFAEQKDLPSFSHYGKKTWLKLSECLGEYRLPPLNLPQEWGGKPSEKPKISMESNLVDLYQALRKEHRIAKRKDIVLNRTTCMLSRLYDGYDSGNLVPRQIHTVGELYSFTDKEFYWFRGYGRKTWLKLNEWLPKYGLQKVKLPQEWSQQP